MKERKQEVKVKEDVNLMVEDVGEKELGALAESLNGRV